MCSFLCKKVIVDWIGNQIKLMCIFNEMAHQVVEIVVRCERTAETKHLGNKTMPKWYQLNKYI